MPRWRYDAQPLLRYATVAEAPLYREIMEIFAQAAAGYASRLSPEDVHAALLARLGPGAGEPAEDVPSIAQVKERLEQLSRWGNLSQDFDTGRATSLESYERTAYVYDLTPGGEAAFEALATLDEALRRVGGLQAVALRQIEEMLGQLVTALRATTQDADRVFALCEDLHARFKGLTANASLFMQKVNRLLAAPVLNPRDFALFKADTITYLNDFIADLDILAVRIRQRLDDLDQVDPAAVTAALAAAEGVSGQIPLDGDADALTWVRQAQMHLTGLEEWFRADAGAGPAQQPCTRRRARRCWGSRARRSASGSRLRARPAGRLTCWPLPSGSRRPAATRKPTGSGTRHSAWRLPGTWAASLTMTACPPPPAGGSRVPPSRSRASSGPGAAPTTSAGPGTSRTGRRPSRPSRPGPSRHRRRPPRPRRR